MLKFRKIIFILSLFLLICITLIGCKPSQPQPDNNQVNIEYYYFNLCGECTPEEDFLESFETITGYHTTSPNVTISCYNLYYPSSDEPFANRMKELSANYTFDDAPLLIINDKIINLATEEDALESDLFNAEIQDKDLIDIEQPLVIFFSSPGCSECEKAKNILEKSKLYTTHQVIEYSISDSEGLGYMRKYASSYDVPEKQQITPILYVDDSYYSGFQAISANIESILSGGKSTALFSVDDTVPETQPVKLLNILASFFIGLLNGFNPCSISMTLMLLSLLIASNKNIKATGLSFAIGKFIGYMLIGTLLYSILGNINFDKVNLIIKWFLILFSSFLAVMNLIDAIHAKNNNYGKIRLQLPKKIRKANHNFINKSVNQATSILSIFIGLALGLVISGGEFLCTGQLYLATIVSMASDNTTLSWGAISQLIIYSLGFVLPIVVVVIVADQTMNSFRLSEFFRKKMFAIKIANMIFFLILLAIAIVYY